MQPSAPRAPLRRSRARHSRGFTLIEAMVVTGIIVVLTALASTAVLYGLNRARAHNASFSVTAMLTLAQTRAVASNEDHFVAVWQQEDPDEPGRPLYGAVLFTLTPGTPEPSWVDLDWAGEAIPGEILESVRMGKGDEVAFVPLALAGLGEDSLPAPFSAVSVAPSGDAGLMAACSFCEAGTAVAGVLRFRPSGLMDLRTQQALTGGAIAIGEGGQNTDTQVKARLIAIAEPAGAMKVYER